MVVASIHGRDPRLRQALRSMYQRRHGSESGSFFDIDGREKEKFHTASFHKWFACEEAQPRRVWFTDDGPTDAEYYSPRKGNYFVDYYEIYLKISRPFLYVYKKANLGSFLTFDEFEHVETRPRGAHFSRDFLHAASSYRSEIDAQVLGGAFCFRRLE